MNESTTTTTASTSPTATVTGKKRKIRQDRWEQNRKKLKRNSGKSYASQSGNKIPRKKFRHTTDCCKKNCSSSFDYKRQREIFKTFWAMAEKPSQDTFLISCIQREEIKYVKTVTKRKNRSWSWKYSFKVDGQDKTVCKGFFLSLLQITESRMKTVLRFCKSGTTVATEKRGKQPNPAKISNVVWSLVKEHWSTLPNKKSHYGSSKTERKYFENPDLNVPKAKGKKFTIQKYVKLSYKPTGTMSVYADYNGAPQNFNLFKLNAFVSKDTELALANPAPVGIKTAKKNDVLSLMPFVKPVNREWYKNVLRGTCNDNDSPETDEMDSD
nr:uncharacterized protein LOC124222307 [Neodiprion pinetum]XP_046489088.1 uncharacterized protein LOC124222310 [Neodiprion pinetum]